MNEILNIGIFMIFIQIANTSYVHTYKSGINWFDAYKKCTEMEGNLVHDNFTLSALDQEVWIGIIKYNELTPWIKLVGCYYYTNENASKSRINSVGECQSHCKTWIYFSYQDSIKDCQCITFENIKRLKPVSFKDCRRRNNLNNVTMVYERLHFDDDKNSALKCMVSICKSNTVQISARTCSNTRYDVQVICDDLLPPNKQNNWNLDFTFAQDECFNSNKNLISPENCSREHDTYSWTNAFRENIKVEYFNEKSGNETPIGCLSGRKNSSGSSYIDILERNCTAKLHAFVCTSSSLVETASNRNDDNDHKITSTSPSTGSVVGGIIGGVFMIVGATLLLVWIRRRKNQAAKSEGVQSNTNRSESSNVHHVSNLQFGLVDDDTASVPEYAAIKKATKLQNKSIPQYAVVQKESKLSPEDTYAVASEGEYDKLNNIFTRKQYTEPNVYGFAGQSGEGEYDSMKGMSALKVNRADNLYDTNASISSGNND